MAVDDHGLEVLKKSGEEVTPGDKSDYYIKTGLVYNGAPISALNPLPTSATLNGDVTIEGDAITSGTVDGTDTGTERTFVNNRKLQVLSAHDVVGTFTWLDFGLRTERVSQIVYTSATFPGVTVTRAFAYTQVGNNYRLDTDTWSVNVGG